MWMWPWETIPEQGKTGFRVSEECWKCLMIWGAGKEYKEGVSSKETEVSRPLKVTYCRTLRTCQGMVWQEERALYLVKTGMWDSLHQIHAIQTISALITDLSTLLTLATSAHSGCGSWADASGLQLYLFLDILFFFFLISQLFFFFSFISISWRLITLQCCNGFCHTLTWISHGFTCVPHPESPSCPPPHPIPLGHPSAPAPSTCLMHPTWTA